MSDEVLQEVEKMLAEQIGNIDPADSKGRKRLRILEAAGELFATQGYRKTNVGEIARKAGIAKGTVYLYYKTKVDILVAALSLEKFKSFATFASVFDDAVPANQRLQKWVEQTLLVTANSPLFSQLLAGDEDMEAVFSDMDPRLLAQRDKGRGWMRDLLHQLAPSHDMDQLNARVDVLSSLAYLAPHLRAPHVRHGVPLEDFAKILADIIVTGIQKEGES